jgi:hypothetical protein
MDISTLFQHHWNQNTATGYQALYSNTTGTTTLLMDISTLLQHHWNQQTLLLDSKHSIPTPLDTINTATGFQHSTPTPLEPKYCYWICSTLLQHHWNIKHCYWMGSTQNNTTGIQNTANGWQALTPTPLEYNTATG